MAHRTPGISTYLQTFILIAVVLAGSAAVYRTVSGYAGTAGGASLMLSSSSITQGKGAAIETATLTNTGDESLGPIDLINAGLPSSLTYCFSAWSPSSRTVLADTCPTMQADPDSIQTTLSLSTGSSVVIEVTLPGAGVFSVGSAYALVATAGGGAQASAQVVAELP